MALIPGFTLESIGGGGGPLKTWLLGVWKQTIKYLRVKPGPENFSMQPGDSIEQEPGAQRQGNLASGPFKPQLALPLAAFPLSGVIGVFKVT